MATENIFSELNGFFNSNTAVAKRAYGLGKQLRVRRIMQINTERIWEQELDAAQRILRPRDLTEAVGKVRRRDLEPVNREWIDFCPTAVIHPHILPHQIARVTAQHRE